MPIQILVTLVLASYPGWSPSSNILVSPFGRRCLGTGKHLALATRGITGIRTSRRVADCQPDRLRSAVVYTWGIIPIGVPEPRCCETRICFCIILVQFSNSVSYTWNYRISQYSANATRNPANTHPKLHSPYPGHPGPPAINTPRPLNPNSSPTAEVTLCRAVHENTWVAHLIRCFRFMIAIARRSAGAGPADTRVGICRRGCERG
ncbi:hypothetical protein BD779DRAFT_309248 [Infundibulicybe gibba]|nr:hypothetical protein BD779DRAFT_309248 [Infundibulicybe gibba]